MCSNQGLGHLREQIWDDWTVCSNAATKQDQNQITMKTTNRTILVAGVVFAISVLGLTGSAAARDSKFDGKFNEWGIWISHEYHGPQYRYHHWETAHNSISLSYDSLAGASQTQELGAGLLHQNQEVYLLKHISVDVNSQLAGWQETIATPDFVWSTDGDADRDNPFYTINGGARQFTDISYSPDKTSLNIVFPTDLPVGTEIVLHLPVQYIGTATFNNNTIPIDLDQYAVAVPEPSSLTVLGLGSVLALIPRWRN